MQQKDFGRWCRAVNGQPKTKLLPRFTRKIHLYHTIITTSVELLLNLLWLAASASLGVALLYSRSRGRVTSEDCVHSHSAAWVCYLVLIAMLLPVISMTDDLQAMVTPTDGEQIVRRMESAVPGHSPVHLHRTVFLQTRSEWLAPLIEAYPLESVRDFHPSYCCQPQTTQGRAPPTAA